MNNPTIWQNPSDKAAWRKKLASRRNALTDEQRRQSADAAGGHLIAWCEQEQVTRLAMYVAFRSELDVSMAIDWCWQTGRSIHLPLCVPQDHSLRWFEVTHWDQLTEGAYGIREPDPERATEVQICDVARHILVPGLGFDRQGGRMGYGGGYYDRFARRLQSLGMNRQHQEEVCQQEQVVQGQDQQVCVQHAPPIWMGVGFEEQIVSHIPREDHDLVVDMLLTEKGLHSCR